MSKREWTDDQKSAIYAKWINPEKTERGNILVNAAAGSGKTAVLVERIIRKLIPCEDNPNPCDVSELLVVTFTNAAASEMRERVGTALSKEFTAAIKRKDIKTQKLLKRQLTLLPSADITTIDSFCLKTVRSYFHLLGIDPDFNIMDSAELGLLKDDAAEELAEKMYEEENKNFLELACLYTDGRDDAKLFDKIKEIYNFIQSFPYPEKWLSQKCEMFTKDNGAVWFEKSLEKAHESIREGLSLLSCAAKIIIESSISRTDDFEKTMRENPPHAENDIYLTWGTYYTAVYDEYFNMKKMLGAGFDEIYALSQIDYIDLRKKADFVNKDMQIQDKELKAQVKNLRNLARDESMRGGVQKYINTTSAELSRMLSENLGKTVGAFSDMVLKFSEIYSRIKSEKNVMEFSDIEHLALKLFSEHEDVRKDLCEKYEEILMDEYQDSNRLQEEIFKLISRGDNSFMVGDMKQSIYRFRNSDPTIFKEKSDAYQKDECAKNRKIVLSKNFRSRHQVLDSINAVFELIMTEKETGIEYDSDQKLYPGDPNYLDKNPDYRSECILIENGAADDDDESENLDKVRLEARVIAAKIADMKRNGFLVRDSVRSEMIDPKTGKKTEKSDFKYRPLQNKDITILMSSFKGVADIYADELAKRGIDCYAESDGYFERNEIKLITALLKIIENPYQDIPLLAILRSPIGGFSDDDLVTVRLCSDAHIYTALKTLAKEDQADELPPDAAKAAAKANVFLENLQRWRSYITHMTSDKLLWTLFEETGIYSFVGALGGGEEAQANLRLLFERAKKYEETGYKGIFNFIRYIGLLKKKNEDLSTAPTVTQNHDVVRIMTIHKSKGLEFPVVFLAGAAKKFNLRDTAGDILLHRDMGFGLDFIDFEKSIKLNNVTKTVISDIIRNESIAEETRKLYVAMTRAKEKLIVTAAVGAKKADGSGGADEFIEKCESELDNSRILKARSFIDWILPAAVKNTDTWLIAKSNPVSLINEESTAAEVQTAAPSGLDIDKFMNYRYPYNSADIPSKVSVTELKSITSAPAETELIPMPEFLRSDTPIKGAARGTVIHYIMQKIPLAEDMSESYVKSVIENLVMQGKLTEEEANAAEPSAISRFYSGSLGKRMKNSAHVFREQTFEVMIPASEVDESYPPDENVILQGVIDCFFEEDGEYVLVDYKSDYYDDPSKIALKYTKQLTLYKDAIEKITKKTVKSKYLYLFFGGDVIEL